MLNRLLRAKQINIVKAPAFVRELLRMGDVIRGSFLLRVSGGAGGSTFRAICPRRAER